MGVDFAENCLVLLFALFLNLHLSLSNRILTLNMKNCTVPLQIHSVMPDPTHTGLYISSPTLLVIWH